MKQGSVDDIQGQFDIIFLNHVWEHLLDPVGALTKTLRHLKSGGIIYIAVPNIFNGMLFQFQNAHTYYFDPRTFHYYASTAGLNMISFGSAEGSHMFGIFKPGEDRRVRDLKGHYKDVLWKLRAVRLKRSIKVCIRSLGLMK
jgi:SAM-dependent methyltransferase